MSNKDAFNRGGMFLFAVGFLITLGFFAYTMAVSSGPIDTGLYEVPVKFTKAQSDERVTSWKQLTDENIQHGQQIYSLNCAGCHSQGGQDLVLSRLQAGQLKYGNKPLEFYAGLKRGYVNPKGVNLPRIHQMDHIPAQEKWASIAFLRSKARNSPDDSKSEWQDFLEKGLY